MNDLPAVPTFDLGRLWRFTLKELREVLRDRRTIMTLILMPLLLYPLLAIAMQQLFRANAAPAGPSVSAAACVPCGTKKPVNIPIRRGLAADSADTAPHNPPREAANMAVAPRPTSCWIEASIRSTRWRTERYSTASLVFRKSVINMLPGA